MSLLSRLTVTGLLAVAALALPAVALGGEGKKPEHAGSSLTYLRLPALTANLPAPGGHPGVLSLEVGLDIPDAKLKERAEQMTPRLRDAYRRALQSVVATTPPGAPPDLDRVSNALQMATDRVLGRPGAKVLIGTAMTN